MRRGLGAWSPNPQRRGSNFQRLRKAIEAHRRYNGRADNSKPVMKPVTMRALALAFSILTGVAIAAAGVDRFKAHGNSLHAYAIIEIDGVMDQRVLQDVLTRTSAVAASFGGRTITEAGGITGRDAVPPNKVVLIAFDSIEDAEAWSTSAAEAEL